MTDADVLERAAGLFRTKMHAYKRGRQNKPYFAIQLRGRRAVLLMHDLLPAMGLRRADAIERCLAGYVAPSRQLDYPTAERIRALHAGGRSIAGLARAFDLSYSMVHQIVSCSIYFEEPATPGRTPTSSRNGAAQGHWSPCELHWLAGWLEGEGSFLRPPPSDPRRARVSAQTLDEDVAREVGRLFGVTPTKDQRRASGRSEMWRVLARGSAAIRLMADLRPLMGIRRREQIDTACRAVSI